MIGLAGDIYIGHGGKYDKGDTNVPSNNKVAPERQNIDDNKALLNLGTPEFEKIVELAGKHPAEKLIKFARTKFKVSTEVAEAINNLYK